MKESTTVGRTAGGVMDGGIVCREYRVKRASIKLTRQQDVYRLPIHHVYASMSFQEDGLTQACLVAASW